MDLVSYQQQALSLNQLNDVVIDKNTLINGQGILYNSTSKKWENSDISGGGGGGGLTGTNLAALFLDGTQGNAFGDAITSNVGATGFAMNVDRTNKRIGINKNNPTVTLDVAGNSILGGNLTVNGTADFTDNSQTIKISEEKIGLTTGTNELKLYSSNLPATLEGLTTVDSTNKKTSSSAFRTYDPVAPDVANTTDTNSYYKMRLRAGTDRQTIATPAFDIQEVFPAAPPLEFPTQQVVEYQNKVPLHKPICMMRTAGPIIVSPATARVVSVLGQQRGVPFFDDSVLYDPLNMRSRLTAGTGWNKWGAPVVYRVPDLRVGWTISWSIHGTWTSGASNRCDLYLNQFRNGALFRTILIHQLEADREFWLVGKRTFLTWTSALNEDFDPTTDDYELEIANQGAHDFIFNEATCEAECWIAQ